MIIILLGSKDSDVVLHCSHNCVCVSIMAVQHDPEKTKIGLIRRMQEDAHTKVTM